MIKVNFDSSVAHIYNELEFLIRIWAKNAGQNFEITTTGTEGISIGTSEASTIRIGTSSILNPQSSILNPQSSILNPQY